MRNLPWLKARALNVRAPYTPHPNSYGISTTAVCRFVHEPRAGVQLKPSKPTSFSSVEEGTLNLLGGTFILKP